MLDQGPMASILYGARAYGSAPSELLDIRRKYAKGLRRAWPGRCLSTLIDLEGSDPGVVLPVKQLEAWFDLWAARPDLRPAARRAWRKIWLRLVAVPAKQRWKQRRGVIGSLILTMWELGWNPREAEQWTDPEGNHWNLDPEDADGDPTELIEAVAKQAKKKIWREASQHHNGAGLEEGADTSDLRRHLQSLRRNGKHQQFGVLLATACAGSWSPARRNEVYPETTALCACGEIADDFHIIWGCCPCRPDHAMYRKTDHLRDRAERGKTEQAAFWLRGITPRNWSCPPACDSEPAAHYEGEAAHLREGDANSRLRPGPGERLLVCGDGSGGEYGSDPRYRRCGWAWALMGAEAGPHIVRAAAQGPLPGPRQTNNRAELYAFLHTLRSTHGPLTYWTDSDILKRGWDRRRHAARRFHRGNGDLWRMIAKELRSREGGELDIDVAHINSHIDLETALTKGWPPEAWHGNAAADHRAGEAAAAHQIPEQRMACFEWVRATSHLVRQRIIQAQLDALSATPPWSWHEKQPARAKRAEAKQQKATFFQLVHTSPHALTKMATGGWKCTTCLQCIGGKQRGAAERDWLKRCTGPPPPPAAYGSNRGRSIMLKGKYSHGSHELRWSRWKSMHFCGNCGGTAKAHISSKMASQCKGRPPTSSQRCVLDGLIRHG